MMIELIFAIALPFIKMYRLIFEKQTKKKRSCRWESHDLIEWQHEKNEKLGVGLKTWNG